MRTQPPPAELENGTPISQHLLAKLMCAAEIIPVLVDGLGNPLDVGRTLRLHTTKQRIALAERDRGCTWMHCTAPASWCEAHHLTPW
ncbi:MAG: HNH endonuclease signature motif containing protein, partial [Angustibacter sp.]